MVIRLLTLALIAVVASAQQGSNGRSYPIPVSTATKVISFGTVCQTGAGTSPQVCGLGAGVNPGAAVFGVIAMNGTDATLGTITDGGSTYTANAKYANGSSFQSYTFYTCNYQGTGDVSIPWTGTASWTYIAVMTVVGQTRTGCLEAYNKAQSTSAGTSYASAAITTTNPESMVLGLATNGCGGAYSSWSDGTHSMTERVDHTGVAGIGSYTQSAVGTWTPAVTGPNCAWNMEAIAVR